MNSKLEEKIKERLHVIYEDEEKESKAFSLLNERLSGYQEQGEGKKPFSEEDSILITYGDTLTDKGRKGLEVLGDFL